MYARDKYVKTKIIDNGVMDFWKEDNQSILNYYIIQEQVKDTDLNSSFQKGLLKKARATTERIKNILTYKQECMCTRCQGD